MNDTTDPSVNKNKCSQIGDKIKEEIFRSSVQDSDVIFNFPDLCGLTISTNYLPQYLNIEYPMVPSLLE